jgi:hypothetical protein
MAFTAIDGDTSWQDLDIAEELTTSYNRRRALCGLSTVSAPTEASQVYAFVAALQVGIEQMANNLVFLDNTSSLSGYEGQSAYPNKMSLSTAMTAAGLIANGYWRRIANGGTQPAAWTNYAASGWSYGQIQDKDLAGPWLFKDLQLAMSALTRAKLAYTQYRKKEIDVSYWASSMPSASLSFGSWLTGEYNSIYYVQKNKTVGNVVEYVRAYFKIAEYRFDVSDLASACESGRLLLTRASSSGTDSYSTYSGKVLYSNLNVADVTTVFNQTVGNASTSSSSGGVTSYIGILAEDASNVIPLYNNIIPDANVPYPDAIVIGVGFGAPCLIVDFAFE